MNNIINVISSSSSGNCYIYNQDLMLDVGVSFSKIKEYLKDIKLLCLTHEHTDHLRKKTIQKLIYERPTIKIVCGEWLVEKLINLEIPKKNIIVLKLNKKYDFGKYIIEIFPAEHDVGNCGYKITIKKNNYKIFHVTDVSNLDKIEAKNYNWYSIEANYMKDMLDEHLKNCNDEGTLYYLERVSKTHLSYEQANSFLIDNMGENSEYIYVHESSYNFKEE